jgi:hypothetical protein
MGEQGVTDGQTNLVEADDVGVAEQLERGDLAA